MGTRKYNTDVRGNKFDSSTKDKVWNKLFPSSTFGNTGSSGNTNVGAFNRTAKDICGDEIHYDDYGKETPHGWEIDHIRPVSAGGKDDLSNLQALYWKTNRSKSDRLNWSPSKC